MTAGLSLLIGQGGGAKGAAGDSTAAGETGAVGPRTGAAPNEEGAIYRLPPQSESGKPYIGSADDLPNRMATRRDGRSGPATKIDTFKKGNLDHRHYKEQNQINKHGGKAALDNARNAASPKRMEKLKEKFKDGN
jgi:hypothetical protein